MKAFTLFLLSTVLYFGAMAQCIAPTITASGSTTLCPGSTVRLSAPASNGWTRKADFGGAARYGDVGFSIGSKGYIGTGSSSPSTYYKDFWEYDPGYTYVWSPGGQTTSSIIVRAAGNYTITVTNASGAAVLLRQLRR